ncbi:hypothetical protein GN244_ATG02524 [Phytophthora infestans]|uniref:DDE Tnp4 domain-containing protein n=1 Tax=Phytophthora infestans TaxID=4787 RepID=A0A833WPB8_PHYIN|nr:hypothetical protein GN244_ATG02524 [Phytophthora infestans]KAF4149949.1 hypothetical protein GN958_ATG00888 [Phytophthora infestans]
MLPETTEECNIAVDGFRRVQGFLLCCVATDGTLIGNNHPCDFEGWFNRKGSFPLKMSKLSGNIADGLLLLTSNLAPGVHKSFQHSSLGRNIKCLLPRGHHALTDSGYGVAPTNADNFKL